MAIWYKVVSKRVFLGIVVAGVLLLSVQSGVDRSYWYLGMALTVCGELLRTWASGHIQKNRRLATTGPYRFWRHPLYVGSMCIGCGLALVTGYIAAIPIVALLFVLVYMPHMYRDEQLIRKRFGNENVEAFLQSRGRWLPNWNPVAETEVRYRWDLRRMWKKHREWHVWWALVMFWIAAWLQ